MKIVTPGPAKTRKIMQEQRKHTDARAHSSDVKLTCSEAEVDAILSEGEST